MMTKNHTALLLMLGSLSLPATVQAAGANPRTAPAVIAAAEKEGQLTVYATTDQVVAAPLLKDFAVLYPKIKVEYNDMNSTEVYNRFVSEAAAKSGVTIANPSQTDPIVMLKHFGPGNPQAPPARVQ